MSPLSYSCQKDRREKFGEDANVIKTVSEIETMSTAPAQILTEMGGLSSNLHSKTRAPLWSAVRLTVPDIDLPGGTYNAASQYSRVAVNNLLNSSPLDEGPWQNEGSGSNDASTDATAELPNTFPHFALSIIIALMNAFVSLNLPPLENSRRNNRRRPLSLMANTSSIRKHIWPKARRGVLVAQREEAEARRVLRDLYG
jgi:hypothetical protein